MGETKGDDVPERSKSSTLCRLMLVTLLAAAHPISYEVTDNLILLALSASIVAAICYAQSCTGAYIASSKWTRPQMRRQASVAIIVTASLAFCLHGWNGHKAHPLTADELCSLGQARAFKSFSATLPLTAFSKYEDPTNGCFARSDKGYFSVQGPGWPALLATLQMSGISQENIPWLIATTTILLTGIAGLIVSGLPVALMSMVVLANNQFFDEISRSMWSHSACLLFVTMAIVSMLLATSPKTKRQRTALSILGVSLGLAMLTRPLVGFSCLTGVMCALTIVRGDTFRFTYRNLLSLLIGPTLAFFLYGLFNDATTGSFLVSGYEFVHGTGHNPGLFHVAPNGTIHSPERALMLLHHHVRHLVQFVLPYRWTFWAVVAVSVTIGWTPRVAALMVVLCAMWFGAATYWDSSYFVGPRFYYESTTLITLLITMGVWSLTEPATFLIRSPRVASIAHIGIFVLISVLLLPSPPVQ